MANISVKLKAIMTNEQKEKIEEAHELFNEGVKKFEEFLILSQGKDYYFTDEKGEEHYSSQEETREKFREYLRNISGIKNIDECIELFSSLSDIVREKKSQAAGMLAKLYSRDSTAGTNNIAKIVEPIPDWVEYFDEKNNEFSSKEWKDKADAWIASNKGQDAIKPSLAGSGRPSAFKLAYTSGKEWYQAFVKDQNKYRKDLTDGLSNMLNELDKNNALPSIALPTQLIDDFPIWVKLQLKTALENYVSYLESDANTRENYAKAVKKFEEKKEVAEAKYGSQLILLDKFLNNTYYSENNSIYLTSRMCRGLKTLIISWKKCKSEAERINELNSCQADKKKQREIGDVNFLRWLALEDNKSLLDDGCIDTLLYYYNAKKDVDQKRKCASFTTADSLNSKRYLFYESEKGSNYRKYKLESNNGVLNLCIPILLKTGKDVFAEESISFDLAKSAQFSGPDDPEYDVSDDVLIDKTKVWFSNGKKIKTVSGEIINETFEGELGGADIRVEHDGVGKIKNVYLSVLINIENKCSPEFKRVSEKTAYSFGTAYDGKATKHDDVIDGKVLRALSIDLGLKQFGAAAVGKIKFDKNNNGLNDFTIERQFMLRLEGEKSSFIIENHRNEENRIIFELKKGINYLSFLKRVYNLDDLSKRKKLIENAALYTNNIEKNKTYQYLLQEIDMNKQNDYLSNEYECYIAEMNDRMKEFRSGDYTKKQKRLYSPRKTMWSIAYLEDVRKLIMSWNSLGYKINDDNKSMSVGYGVTATNLLNHINNIKDDRIKTGADLIIQSARGYVYDEDNKCWIKKYEPCNVIIFEDLSRYRFRTDRPKRENSKLMQWSHRGIVEETKRQAELYGIQVYDSTDAAYSSKFYNKTDTPGIRCDRLKKTDFNEKGSLHDYVYERLPESLKSISEKMKVGDMIPSEIGSLFVTLDENDNLLVVNADMNAACNLQKRFWRRHTHLVQLNTTNKDGKLFIKSDDSDEDGDQVFGKRIKGKFLLRYGTDKVILTSASSGEFKIVPKDKKAEAPKVGDGIVYRLFNDASGVFFDKELWIGSTEFWEKVNSTIIGKLRELKD